MKLSPLTALVLVSGVAFSAGASASESERPLTSLAADRDSAVMATEDGAQPVARRSGEPSFLERYFPVALPDDLEPEVEGTVLIVWLSSVFLSAFCAPLWVPALVTGQGFPEDFVVDLLVSYLLHLAVQFIPFVGALMVPINCLYLCPVATISIYDRNLKKQRRGKRSAAMSGPAPSALAFAEAPGAMAF